MEKVNTIVNEKCLDKDGNPLRNGDAVCLHGEMFETNCIVRNGKLYVPEHYLTYHEISQGEYLPKSIAEIDAKYLERIDANVFKEFPYCDNTLNLEYVKRLVGRIQKRASSGGSLHIVLEDDNIDAHSIKWCLENSIPKEKDAVLRIDCQELAEILLTLTLEERIKYLGIDTDYLNMEYLLQKENDLTLKSLIEIKEEANEIKINNVGQYNTVLRCYEDYLIYKNNFITKEIVKRLPTEGIEYMIKIMQEELKERK